MNPQISKMSLIDLQSIISLAQNAAVKQPKQKTNHRIIFTSGVARVLNSAMKSYVSELKLTGTNPIFFSDTYMRASDILDFADYCEKYNVDDVQAYYTVYNNNTIGIRVLFQFHGQCDYYWELKPLWESNAT